MIAPEYWLGDVTSIENGSPLYDAFVVPEENGGGSPAPTFATEMAKRDARILRYFIDVQNKTRLETNLQASGTLPSLNSYEVRAM